MKLIVNILLMLASIFLLLVLAPLGVSMTIILLFFKDDREIWQDSKQYPFSIAYAIDMLGNVICADLFNLTLIKIGGYQFGQHRETISSAIGKNLKANKLTLAGLALNWFLNQFEKDHALKSIQYNP